MQQLVEKDTDDLDRSASSSLYSINEEEMRRRREKSDRDSAKLGQKLLMGWRMLDEYCPRQCLVPQN